MKKNSNNAKPTAANSKAKKELKPSVNKELKPSANKELKPSVNNFLKTLKSGVKSGVETAVKVGEKVGKKEDSFRYYYGSPLKVKRA